MGKCLRQQLLGFFSADLLPNNVEDGPRRENHQKLFFNFPIALGVYFTVVCAVPEYHLIGVIKYTSKMFPRRESNPGLLGESQIS